MRGEVERALPKGGWGAKLADDLRHLVVKTSGDQRYAVEAILIGRGHRAERTPPYEKRLNCTELWWAAIKTHYRSSAASERKVLGVGELVRRRMARTRGYEISGYMSHTHDFAVAVADGDYAEVARLDPELASALQKMGG